MLTRDDVINALDLLLGAVPDEATIDHHLAHASNRAELSRNIIASGAFQNRLSEVAAAAPATEAAVPATGYFEEFERLAAGVDGWFSDMSAALFDILLTTQAQWGVRGHALEIGVAYGRSAILPALHGRSDETLRLVDFSEPTLNTAVAMLRPLAKGRFEAIRASSFDLKVDEAERGTFRFAHIDGDHSYDAVFNDLGIADALLGPEGIVVLDDFFSPQYAGITMAAGAYLERHPDAFRLILTGFNKGYFCRPGTERRYLELIRDTFPASLSARRQGDFTLWRMLHAGQAGGFGLGTRQYGRDFVTLTTDINAPITDEVIPI